MPLQDDFRSDAILAPQRPLGSDRLSRHHLCLTSLALSSFPLSPLQASSESSSSTNHERCFKETQPKNPSQGAWASVSKQNITPVANCVHLNLCCGPGAACIFCLCFSFIFPLLVPPPDPTEEENKNSETSHLHFRTWLSDSHLSVDRSKSPDGKGLLKPALTPSLLCLSTLRLAAPLLFFRIQGSFLALPRPRPRPRPRPTAVSLCPPLVRSWRPIWPSASVLFCSPLDCFPSALSTADLWSLCSPPQEPLLAPSCHQNMVI